MSDVSTRDPDQALWAAAIAEADSSKAEASILRLGSILLRHRRAIVLIPAILALAVLGWAMFWPATYASGSIFLPDNSESSSGALSSVASQLGLSLQSQSGVSPEFYADLVTTPRILRGVADSLKVTANGTQVPLSQVLEVTGDSPQIIREGVVGRLAAMITSGVDAKTGVIRYDVHTNSPDLSFQIARSILKNLNAFDVETRHNRAAAEQRFIEDQLASSMVQLRTAEERLESFLQKNRQYQNDPQLGLQFQRLSRDVRIREQVYTSLAQTLERTSIESSRTTPSLSVVQEPTTPVFPERRPTLIVLIIAIMSGFMLAVASVLLLEHFRSLRDRQPGDYAELALLGRHTLSDFVRPWRLFRRSPS
jgi:uncharacterized protein involved in exopolysaccharide biosynthesis